MKDEKKNGVGRFLAGILAWVLAAAVFVGMWSFLLLLSLQSVLRQSFLEESLASFDFLHQELRLFGVEGSLLVVPRTGNPDSPGVTADPDPIVLQDDMTVLEAVRTLAEGQGIDSEPLEAVLASPALTNYMIDYVDGCVRYLAGGQPSPRPEVDSLQQYLRGQQALVTEATGKVLSEEEWLEIDRFLECFTEDLLEALPAPQTRQQQAVPAQLLSRLLLQPSAPYFILGGVAVLLLLLLLVRRWWAAPLLWGGAPVFFAGISFWIVNLAAGAIPSLLSSDSPLLSSFLHGVVGGLTERSFLWGLYTMLAGAAMLILYFLLRARRDIKREAA